MARIIVTGGGMGGLTAAMLLAGDGHDVTVLERDAAPPGDPETAWEDWERRGVNQFRLLHFFLPLFRQIMEAELPAVSKQIEAAGALRLNSVVDAPEFLRGPVRVDDSRYDGLTARRPVMEAIVARCAAETVGVTVRRGIGVAGLVAGGGAVPHVTGVRTEHGEELSADLVVDATGRRSPLPSWLEAIGGRRPAEEVDDSGFVYYGRHFTSADGSLPAVMGPLLQSYGSISCLSLPCDHGTWGLGIIASSGDAALRGLRHADVWDRVARALPLTTHWLDGSPLESEPTVMAKIEDRHRSFCVDGEPVATGVLALGDSWACTNPSVGRGASIALRHAVALRDLLRTAPSDPRALALAWHDTTAAVVEPMFRATLDFDRGRLAEIDAEVTGREYTPDPGWELTRALMSSAFKDPDCFRAFLTIVSVLALPEEVFADTEVFRKVIELGSGWRDDPPLGPSRAELLTLVEG